jgi:hypothetical protein
MLISSVVVTDDRQAAAEEVARARGLTGDAVLANPYLLIGSVDQIVEGLLEQRERYGISYITVYEADMQTFAPVVARLAGQ